MAVLSRLKDPFALTPDPALYVPRPDTEAALDQLRARVAGGAHATTLMGPSGFGKTLLLRLLGERLGPAWRVVYLPYPKLTLGELWTWLHRDPQAESGERSARRLAAEAQAQGGGLVLCVDDAHQMPTGTRDALEAVCRDAPGLAVVWAETCDAEELVAASDVVTLGTPLTPDECDAYLWGRLDRGLGNEAERAVFRGLDPRLLAQQTAGVPSQIHRIAIALLRGEAPARGTSRARAESVAREAWTTPQLMPPQLAGPLHDGPEALDLLEVDPGFEGRLDLDVDPTDAANGLVLEEAARPAAGPPELISDFGEALEVDPFDPVAMPSLELDPVDVAGMPMLEADEVVPPRPVAAPSRTRRVPARQAPARARPVPTPHAPARAAMARGGRRRRRLLGTAAALAGLWIGAGVILSGVLTPGQTPWFVQEAEEVAAGGVTETPVRTRPLPAVSAGPEVAAKHETELGTDFGTLQIKAPPGTLVLVDGERQGETPLADLRVPYGERRVIVRFAEGRYRGLSVEIGPTPTVLEFAEAGRSVRR